MQVLFGLFIDYLILKENNIMYIKIILIIILLSTLISPICHAQSVYTDEQIEEWYNHEIKKLEYASVLADYIYKRIKFYEKYNDDWIEQYYMLWYMYEALQEME